jgi:OOP family OmpA-OmpF porin
MNRIKTALAATLPAILLAFGAPASAQDSGWYIGGAYGMTSVDVDTSGLPGVTIDDGDSGFKIYGGYQFNKHLGAEAGYVDFGKFPVTAGSTGDLSLTAYTFAAVGTLPLNEAFALYGKAGLWMWESDSSIPGTTGTDDSDLFVGIGVRYNFNKNLGLTLDVEQYDASDAITMTSIGLRYKF